MLIALTSKLSQAMGINPSPMRNEENPLFSWTANWTNVWANRKTENMLVLVNNATRFTVAIYEVKRKALKNLDQMMKKAISNTLLFININPEIVDDYMRMCGEVTFVKNNNRQAAAWVTKAGLECAMHVGNEYNGVAKMFSDTLGALINRRHVNYSRDYNAAFYPYQEMVKALSELTGKQAYKYRAFELSVTLDLEVYKATRRIIVPADLKFIRLHKVLQSVFNWENCHLYEFSIIGVNKRMPVVRIVPSVEELDYDETDVLIDGHRLSEFLPEYKRMLYTYDMGDSWEHEIELVRVIEDCDRETPYLLEASGQTPPEDVGGVGGFVRFREIIMNPKDPEHDEIKQWARFWSPELEKWQSRPRVL